MATFTPDYQTISILYAEDDPVTRDLFSRMIPMKFPGVRLHVAENGMNGLALYREHTPEIVITDINMPILDGIGMSAEIKALRPETVIIVVSAYGDTNYLLDAIEIGVNHYVLKPIDHKKLFTALEKSIAGIVQERRLRQQNERIRKLSTAVEQSPSMVMITDREGIIEYVNPKFCEISGYPAEELIGQSPRLLQSSITSPETYRTLWRTIIANREWHGEFLNRKKDGELYWESASISPITDEDGVITHFVAVKEDITARKRAAEEIEALNANLELRAVELETANFRLEEAFHEVEAANHQLEMTNHELGAANQELEAFNYTVSHDLRKPLTNINGYCQVILNLCANQLDETSRRYLQEIYSGTLRMNKLIDTLLNFSRLSRSEIVRKRVDLSGMANDIAAGLMLSAPRRQVTFMIADGVTANGDGGLLKVVLENLIGNAWKYSGRKEAAVIEFGMTGEGREPAYFVRDNGAGFDMAQAGTLFAPFHRLHSREEFEGHGIGLATVQRIVQRHGGRIWAEAKPEEGATFYFTLP
jgi:PAS domain S-box-containing protein